MSFENTQEIDAERDEEVSKNLTELIKKTEADLAELKILVKGFKVC